MKTNEFNQAISVPTVRKLVMQFQPPPPGATDYFYMYNVTDAFITPRPWWSIVREPRVYDNNQYRVLLERVPEKLEETYRIIASKQYPSDCSLHKLHVRNVNGYSEFGNKIYDERNGAADAWNRGMIYTIVVSGWAQYMDPGYCPFYDLSLCAHLPMTSCLYPDEVKQKYETLNVFDKATLNGKRIIDYRLTVPFDNNATKTEFHASMTTYFYTVRGFNDSSPVFMSTHRTNIFLNLLSTGIGHRYNSLFRNLIDEEIHNMRVTSKPVFPVTEQCVAIHIRHFDRHIAGEQNMIEWCDKFVHYPNGTCADRYGQTRDCVFHYIGYGCDLNPFGAIHFKHYIHAASLILPNVKNIFIMTDDGPWVEHHKHSVQHKFNVYTIHGTNYHSKNSIANGVNLFASIEAARQCSGFVGHSRSAIYGLMMQYMCTRHGPEGRRKYGQCPPAFNFGMTHHEGYDQPYLPPMEEDS
jgi:hypothetical protein